MLTTAEADVAVTPIPCKLVSALTAAANADAIVVNVSDEPTV